MSLYVKSIRTQQNFAAMAPKHPLPWNMEGVPSHDTVIVVDANGRSILQIKRDGNYSDAVKIAGMILVAVNTCGGFAVEPDAKGDAHG